MRFLALVALLFLPGVARAQPGDCPSCVLGIFDDPGVSRNFGFWDASVEPTKTLWVGIVYDPSTQFRNLQSIDLSVDGIEPFCSDNACLTFDGLPEPAVTVGTTIVSPEDKETGEGGVTVAWNSCLPGNRALIRLDLRSLDTVPHDLVLRVLRRFPPSDPRTPHPGFLVCARALLAPPAAASGGCYVINPTVGPGGSVDGCTLVETSSAAFKTWSLIKALYQ